METIKIKVKTNLYPLDVIYSTAYVFLDKSYVVLDGDPEKEIEVELALKKKGDLEKLKNDFLNELLNYAFYKNKLKETYSIRELILNKALFENIKDDDYLIGIPDGDFEDLEGIATPWEDKYDSDKNSSGEDDNLEEEFESFSPENDPEGIALPWDEKYGKDK
jgi:His-Xaa-Ser system protein HxsD